MKSGLPASARAEQPRVEPPAASAPPRRASSPAVAASASGPTAASSDVFAKFGRYDPRPHLPANWRGDEQPAPAVRKLLTCFHEVAAASEHLFASPGETFVSAEGAYHHPRFIFFGARGAPGAVRVVLFAGWSAHDLAGTLALFNVLQRLIGNPAAVAGYNLLFYPLVDVTGFLSGTAESALGDDLRQISWTAGLPPPEIRSISADLERFAPHGWITLGSSESSRRIHVRARGVPVHPDFLPVDLPQLNADWQPARATPRRGGPEEGLATLTKTAFGLAIDSDPAEALVNRVAGTTDLIFATLARYRTAISFGGDL